MNESPSRSGERFIHSRCARKGSFRLLPPTRESGRMFAGLGLKKDRLPPLGPGSEISKKIPGGMGWRDARLEHLPLQPGDLLGHPRGISQRCQENVMCIGPAPS